MIVPEKTIAAIPLIFDKDINQNKIDPSLYIKTLSNSHKREWFSPNFYRCLPLSIGNMQGFAFSIPYSIKLLWNGGKSKKDISIFFDDDFDSSLTNHKYVEVSSQFGNGIFTVHFPFILKTPPGVNLMTIAPPNFPVPGISPMTGVIETDNLRYTFSLNFKIDFPEMMIKINKDYPIMGIIPIPRYYCDSFKILNAYDIFEKNAIEEEQKVWHEHQIHRHEQNNSLERKTDALYYKGMDIRKNKFDDHQLPKEKI